MKKFGILFLVLIFSVNSIVVSAWGASCPHKMTSIAEIQTSDMASDMPCHEQEQTPASNHCDGLCLCAHVTAAPITILGEHVQVRALAHAHTTEYVTYSMLLSFIHTPQGPPPKLFA